MVESPPFAGTRSERVPSSPIAPILPDNNPAPPPPPLANTWPVTVIVIPCRTTLPPAPPPNAGIGGSEKPLPPKAPPPPASTRPGIETAARHEMRVAAPPDGAGAPRLPGAYIPCGPATSSTRNAGSSSVGPPLAPPPSTVPVAPAPPAVLNPTPPWPARTGPKRFTLSKPAPGPRPDSTGPSPLTSRMPSIESSRSATSASARIPFAFKDLFRSIVIMP